MNRTKCEVWSRIVGYLRPTAQWNEGKLDFLSLQANLGISLARI